jgi:outer membrane protein insertion porin family
MTHLGFEGAALTALAAAHKRFCLPGLMPRLGAGLGVLSVALAFSLPVGIAAQDHVPAQVASAGVHSAAVAVQGPAAQQPRDGQFVVERIDFVGNRRIRSDTLKARIFSRVGDPYSEEALRRDFEALWNTQFFEDIMLRVEDSPDNPHGKIIVFEVKERPVIRRIRYEGLKSVTESDILDRFKDRKVGLTVESQFDPTRIKKAQVVLQELLSEHGHQFAKVTPEYERIAASNAVILIFKVDEGPKVKVGRIRFTGNHAFSDRRLIRAMKHSRPIAIPMHWFSINVGSKTFDRSKLDEDLEVGIRGLYQDNGYFKVLVKDPILETVDVDRGGVPFLPLPGVGRKHGKITAITIPIEEGGRYRMGALKIVSADPDKGLSLKADALKAMFPIKEGDIFSAGKVRKAFDDYKKAYGQYGFIDFTSEPVFDIDEAGKRINLTLKFDEQKMYYVRRIEFSGNTTTRDKVIRREILIDEGQLFNQRFWEVSILRLNQLDYFEKIKPEDAEIKRNTKEGSVDINLKLKEKGKQSISLQGGSSGLAGSFIGLTYQTNNFLGLGETLTLSAQIGDVQRSLMFGFTEPYLFDRPISTGFTIFDSRYNFDQSRQTSILLGQQVLVNPAIAQNYVQNSTGFTVFGSYPLRHFSFMRVGLTYGLTRSNIQTLSAASTALFTLYQFRSLSGPSALNGILESRVTPSLSYNTVDNPINPTHGKSIFLSSSFEGGPLGGNVNAITNTFEWKYFHPINKHRNVLGFRVQAAYATSFGGLGLPPTSRFYIGGEDSVRGFDVRAISPVTFIPEESTIPVTFRDTHNLDSTGSPISRTVQLPVLAYQISLPGGDLQGVGNFEYRIPLVGQMFGMALFLDAGTNGIIDRSGLLLDSAGFTSLQQAFPNATNLSRQIAIQPGTNFHLRTSTGIEFVVQLPIIQAPFRIYFAVNPNRYHQQIIPPAGDFNPQDPILASLRQNYPDVYQNLVLPSLLNFKNNPGTGGLNYLEPFRTIRFTVSRTF